MEDASSSDLRDLQSGLAPLEDLVALIEKSISDDPPVNLRDGGVIRDGFDQELDQLRSLLRDGKVISRLESTERKRTGIKSLKIAYTNVFGYYLEVSRPDLHRVPEDYVRKQTLANAERFITPELKEYEALILNSRDRLADIEANLYRQILGQIGESTDALLALADAVARLDVLVSLAAVAAANSYVKPEINDSGSITISSGRHPVVELSVGPGNFIANDLLFDRDS